jgi:hypothetical protein
LSVYQVQLASLANPTVAATSVIAGLPTLEEGAGLSPDQRSSARGQALVAVIRAAMADSLLTSDEEARVSALADDLGVDARAVFVAVPGLVDEILIANANAGELSALPDPPIILKKGEQAYLSVAAELMKEVVDRHYQGGYSGVSFRVAKGVRVNTGGFRGHSVVTGSHMEVSDQGQLVITSARVVFVGSRAPIELAYAKLISMDGFTDGVRFSVSNRAKAPLFRVRSGPLVLATVNAAMGR